MYELFASGLLRVERRRFGRRSRRACTAQHPGFPAGDAAFGNLDLQIRSPFASSRVAVVPID